MQETMNSVVSRQPSAINVQGNYLIYKMSVFPKGSGHALNITDVLYEVAVA